MPEQAWPELHNVPCRACHDQTPPGFGCRPKLWRQAEAAAQRTCIVAVSACVVVIPIIAVAVITTPAPLLLIPCLSPASKGVTTA